MKKVSLYEITGGALQEQFERAFERVIENLADPNTSYKEARKITISLTFKQNERRDDVACDVLVAEKLATPAPTTAPTKTAFAVGRDLKTGELYAEEYGRSQMSIDDIDAEREESIETATTENPKILNLRHCN